MDALTLSRWQFAITAIYHWLFVPLTLGLALFIALMETWSLRAGNELYRRIARFLGPLLLLNFAMGVVTGIVQEFHFGMNWSEYSRFMGDIFGAPLAIEALLAFYLESTFLGVWFFGWNRVSPKVHAMVAWLFALGSNISAYWILTANSFMQHPVGFRLEGGRAVMSDFFALITNPTIFYQFTHVVTTGIALTGFVGLGISAWRLLRQQEAEAFRVLFRWAAAFAFIGSLLVGITGHFQGQFSQHTQPLKMMAAEAHWETEQPAAFIVIGFPDEQSRSNTWAIRIPALLSFLAYNNFTARVEGLKELEQKALARYGPGDYLPPVTLNFWSFRIMVAAGLVMVIVALLAVLYRRNPEKRRGFLKILPWIVPLPYLASVTGWIVTETGRWPWIVYGLMKIEDAVSPNVSTGSVVFSLVVLTLLYAGLIVLALRLGLRHITSGSVAAPAHEAY